MTALLTLRNVSKRFQATVALDDVSFAVHPGEVHALMGENGAGKSTLMKIAAGLYPPDAGRIDIDDTAVRFSSPADANRHGVHIVFQELTVLPNLDVAHNVYVGHEPSRLGGLWLPRPQIYTDTQKVLDLYGIELNARAPIASLSAGLKQMVEIARACRGKPKVLILDEPTSSLGRQEEDILFSLIERLKSAGVGIVYITHRMSEVFKFSDRITVLRDGKHVVTGNRHDFNRDSLINAMVGRKLVARTPVTAPLKPETLLQVRGLARSPRFSSIDLDLRRGEVLGLGGLMGSGRTELARVLAGADAAQAGTMQLDSKAYAPRHVADAVGLGVAYLPEDRKTHGLLLPLSVGDNILLPSLRRLTQHGLLPLLKLRELTLDWMQKLGVKAASADAGVTSLSGGNQQKVMLARWLATKPRVLLLDEPTRGVDVGAKAEIHALIREVANAGAAVLVISSEWPELLTVCDRIAVMAAGQIAGVLDAPEATEEKLLDLAFSEISRQAA